MDKIKIRSPKKSEFSQILKLLKQLWPNKEINQEKLRNSFLRGLILNDQYYLIAKSSNIITGFASLTIKNNLWQEGNLAHIDEIIVDKLYRGKGIGKNLMDKLIEIAKEKDCRKIELESAFHRKKAHEIYEKNNFINRAYVFSKDL